MGFESFLGNGQVKENLRRSLSNNRISHFYLISGPAGPESIPWHGIWLPPFCAQSRTDPAFHALPAGRS